MKARAAYEKTRWGLSQQFIELQFNNGIRVFFGVAVNEDGELLWDEEQAEFYYVYHNPNSDLMCACTRAFERIDKTRGYIYA